MNYDPIAMRPYLVFLGFAALCTSGSAQAYEKVEQSSSDAPEARTGFQLALRAGVALPIGSAAGASGTQTDRSMGSFVSTQVPFTLDIGWKVIPHLFLGIYGGFAAGGGGYTYNCGDTQIHCVSVSLRAGLQAQVNILPARKVNPWVGYGIGFDSTAVGVSREGTSDTDSYGFGGWDFAQLMAGIDFRLTKVFGIGPYGQLTLGQYSATSAKVAGTQTSGSVENSAMHEWLALGVRGTFFP